MKPAPAPPTRTGGAPTIRVVGRYALYQAIASGGMATVFLGRLQGPVGFARTVAVKRLHPQFASDPEFVAMFLDEARLAARIQHPNVVSTLDVVATKGELFLVMEYVHGEALSKLMRAAARSRQPIPVPVVVSILSGVLQGLDAAHNAKSERGVPLQIVHRDVSPQNILLGNDGQARLLDFGVARAIGRSHSTQNGQIKGKIAYMSPEQVRGEPVEPTTDVYAAAVVLWEALAMRRMFHAENDGALMDQVLAGNIPPPSRVLIETGSTAHAQAVLALDSVVMAALARHKESRWQTARDLARALESVVVPASAAQVSDWVQAVASSTLRERASLVAEIESSSAHDVSSEDLEKVVSGDESATSLATSLDSPPSASPRSLETRKEGRVDGVATDRVFPDILDGARTIEMPTLTLTDPSTERAVVSAATSGVVGQPAPWPPASPPKPARRGLVAGAIGATLLGFFAVVVLAGRGGGATATRAASVEGPAIPVPPPAALPSAPPPAPTPDLAPSAAAIVPPRPAPPAHAVASARVAAPAVAEADAGRAVASPHASAKPSSKPPAANCDPPFTFEKDGLKHYKEECF